MAKEDALRVFVKTAQAQAGLGPRPEGQAGVGPRPEGQAGVGPRPEGTTKPLSIPKSRIKERRKSKLSLMPEGLMDEFSDQDVANLIAFVQAGPPK